MHFFLCLPLSTNSGTSGAAKNVAQHSIRVGRPHLQNSKFKESHLFENPRTPFGRDGVS